MQTGARPGLARSSCLINNVTLKARCLSSPARTSISTSTQASKCRSRALTRVGERKADSEEACNSRPVVEMVDADEPAGPSSRCLDDAASQKLTLPLGAWLPRSRLARQLWTSRLGTVTMVVPAFFSGVPFGYLTHTGTPADQADRRVQRVAQRCRICCLAALAGRSQPDT